MISWARCVLGQTQDAEQEAQNPSVQDALGVALEEPRRARAIERPRAEPPRALWAMMALAVFAAVGTGILLGRQLWRTQQLEHQLVLARQESTRLMAQNTRLTQQLEHFQEERQALDERVSSLGAQLSSAAVELGRANALLAESEQMAQQLKRVQAELKSERAAAKEERGVARQAREQLEQEKADLRRNVARLRQRLAMVERDYRNLSDQLTGFQAAPHPGVTVVSSTTGVPQPSPRAPTPDWQVPQEPGGVTLAPVVVSQSQSGASPSVQGRIIDINQPHRFVVIDRGSLNGVREGMVLRLVRGNEPVGEATVVRVRPRLAACEVGDPAGPKGLRIGDVAVEHLP